MAIAQYAIMKALDFQAVIIPEKGSYSAWSPDLDVASQGDTVEEAIANLKEAIELHIQCLNQEELAELKGRQSQRLTTIVEVAVE